MSWKRGFSDPPRVKTRKGAEREKGIEPATNGVERC